MVGIVSFLFFSIVSWAAGLGLTRLIPARYEAPRTFLALPIGVTAFLLLFSIVAKFFGAYGVAVPLVFLLLFACGELLRRLDKGGERPKENYWQSCACWALFFLVGATSLYLHSMWPALHWENSGNRAGVEKLFNVSLQQSFLYGHGFPPEWIWLHGEVSRYYLLPKVFPGLAAWFARVVAGDPLTGGVQFLLSEALYVSLTSAAVCAWTMIILGTVAVRSSVFSRTLLSVSLGLLVFVDVHGYGLYLGLSKLIFGGTLDWWFLQEQIVRYTNNQYPIWLLILGDNHAYTLVAPFQICLWGATCLLLISEVTNVRLALLCGLSAAAVFLSHAPSVLLNVVSLVPAILGVMVVEWLKGDRSRVILLARNFSIVGAVTLGIVGWKIGVTGDTKWVIPPAEVTTPLLEFLSVQFWPLVWITGIAGIACWGRGFATVGLKRALTSLANESNEGSGRSNDPESFLEWVVVVVAIACVVAVLCGRPAIGGTVVVASLVLVLSLSAAAASALGATQQRALAIFATCAFGIWILPELLAIDNRADNRTLWIRFNIVLRFFPEGYILIPFAVTASLGGALLDSLRGRAQAVVGGGAAFLLVVLFAASHIPALQNRAARSHNARTIDGFAFLAEEAPRDFEIISFLAHLPAAPPVVVAESCGTGRYGTTPINYGWSGRISAFSGRGAVCGWSRHAFLHQPHLSRPQSVSETVQVKETWDLLSAFDEAWLKVIQEGGAALPAWSPEVNATFRREHPGLPAALATLRSLGVTHLVYGEFETRTYGQVNLEQLARVVGGSIAFTTQDPHQGVIALPGGQLINPAQ